MKSEEPTESMLYPKITNHIKEVVKSLRYDLRDPEHPEIEPKLGPIPIIGTVKLHGTHADIIISGNDTITLQSRNNANLLTTADNQGFATAMAKKHDTILQLRDKFIARWSEVNQGKTLAADIPVTIAGEWIGEKIQKGVAIAQLSKRFVIISVKINGEWVLDEDYGHIEAPEDGFYNISRGGIYRSTLYPDDQQRTINDLEPLAEKIAARCPFAESFGVVGEGEGLVWKLVPYISNSTLWFKTKGGKFKPTFTPAPKKPITDSDAVAKKEAATEVARAWCSEMRMEQGWDFLREKNIPQNMKGIGGFLKWVQQDILVEEKGYIGEHKIDEGLLRMEIIAIAKPWFLERYQRGDE
jgi:hypothetical protein